MYDATAPMRRAACALPLLCAPLLAQAGGPDLDELITGLYGGDGVTLATTPIFNHAAHFHGDSLVELERLSTQALDVAIPLTNGDGGTTFVFDPALDDFVAADGTAGTIFAERAQTLGEGRYSLGFSAQRIRYTRFEGTPLDRLQVVLNHQETGGPGPDVCVGGPPPGCHIIELDAIRVDLDLDLRVDVMTLFGTLGLTDRLDVGVVVPVVKTRLRVDALATVLEHETAPFSPGTLHGFDPAGVDGDLPTDSASGSHQGIGDIHLRSRYLLRSSDASALSLSAGLRLPTGDERNLQGIDGVGGHLGVLWSSRWPLGGGDLHPHVNASVEVNAGNARQTRVDLVAGLEYSDPFGWDAVSLAVDVSGTSDVTRRDGIGDDQFAMTIGARWQPNRHSALYFGLQAPLNRNEGLRADWQPHLGFYLSL